MAWFRPMGADEVAYHQATVVGRADDHAGAAIDYYGTRGETPLRWAGQGAARLGLAGEVTPDAYDAAYGPGGFSDPTTGHRLVTTKRPGFELVVSAHKTVAVLGVIDQADAMHSILDVETSATMTWLDGWLQERGGRRGREQRRSATGGLTYAVTRHATSRAGDPCPHDHVLVANVVEMLDETGGFKALDSAALRDTVEAATMVGRLHSAAEAVRLGFDIAADDGPSGNLRHWRIVGVPDAVADLFSKRSDEIAEHLTATGQQGYRARSIAARQTRTVKRHTGAHELMPSWRAELADAGWPAERLTEHLATAQAGPRQLPLPLTAEEIDRLAAEVLDVEGRLLARHKVFTRTTLIAEIAPRLYGRDPGELDRELDRVLGGPAVVPLIGVAGAREQSYTTVDVLAAEQTIANTVETLAARPRTALSADRVARAIVSKEHAIGQPLTDGQRRVVEQLCGPHTVSVVIGVAGSGKTTALDAATTALEGAGYRVLGTSTSGQAARTLAEEAGLEARTFASVLWRLEHGQLRLDDRTVVVVDEAGMADDTALARLLLAVERAGASLVLVGDHRQLAAVGPGGALAALLQRRPDLTVTLNANVRQRDPEERLALTELRDGSVAAAVDWYAAADRIRTGPTRTETLVSAADAWAADTGAGHATALLAWRRADVADLNRLARDRWDRLGRLAGDDVTVAGGRTYAVGDRVVALAPNPEAGIVSSEQLTVTAVAADRVDATATDGRSVRLTGAGIDRTHLDHGYALTIHRAQGATYDRTHLVAGGGRELAYVALSSARERSTIHTVADNLDQAVGDLQADWNAEHQQRWISDTPAHIGRELQPRRAATVETSPDATARRLDDLERDYRDLLAGDGRWNGTPEGDAARARTAARARLADTRLVATDPTTRRRDRRAAERELKLLTHQVTAVEDRWAQVAQPTANRLGARIAALRKEQTGRAHAEKTRRLLAELPGPYPRSLPTPGQAVGMEL